MTLPANACIVVDCFLAGERPMWIVAGLTGQPALALGKTTGLTQPVYRAHCFKFVVVSGTGRMIERNHEILERLPRHERKRASVKSQQRSGNSSAGGLDMTFHANLPFDT